eukprot:5267357-Pleurochrysis_carterae.AAC.3
MLLIIISATQRFVHAPETHSPCPSGGPKHQQKNHKSVDGGSETGASGRAECGGGHGRCVGRGGRGRAVGRGRRRRAT